MDPSGQDSVTGWLHDLKAGDRDAARKLFERYFERLVALARKKLGPRSRRVADEEDVALRAFESFCRVVERGRYDKLDDREDLQKLLFTITERKALDQVQAQVRQKRGGGAVRGDSAVLGPGGEEGEEECGFEVFPSHEPTPADAAALADLVRQLFAALPDPELRRIAQLKIDGHTNEEIRKALGCSLATVERRLAMIRAVWEKSLQGPPA